MKTQRFTEESGYEIDHIKEYRINQNNDNKNLQALCVMCYVLCVMCYVLCVMCCLS
jgi:hypothetical protein